MSNNALVTLTNKLATRLDLGDGVGLIDTLKATAFKGQVSDAQMTALMVVANQYGLNPWTKEIYAFPDKQNGIVPVVGVDGWSRIINNHPQFDGMEFAQDDESCTCIIFRKDRGHPIKVTEYMAECRRANVGPWISHPRRMLRHKTMIQCARLAFGYGGIYDQDEAERIVDEKVVVGEVVREPKLLPYPSEQFDANMPSWAGIVRINRKTPQEIIDMITTKYLLSEAQEQAIRDLAFQQPATEEGEGE
jgi:phage recombination protein Bet